MRGLSTLETLLLISVSALAIAILVNTVVIPRTPATAVVGVVESVAGSSVSGLCQALANATGAKVLSVGKGKEEVAIVILAKGPGALKGVKFIRGNSIVKIMTFQVNLGTGRYVLCIKLNKIPWNSKVSLINFKGPYVSDTVR